MTSDPRSAPPSAPHAGSSAEPTTVAVVGHTGLIGTPVAALLRARGYRVLGLTHQTTPAFDLRDPGAADALFATHAIDHLVIAAGDARFASREQLDAEALEVGLRHKLMGQVHAALGALRHLPRGGSVTLTSGALAHHPIPGSAAVALVNGALDSFVRAVALEAPDGRRVNVVSPGWIRETRLRLGLEPGDAVSAEEVAKLYLHAIESDAQGEVIEVATSPLGLGGRDRARGAELGGAPA